MHAGHEPFGDLPFDEADEHRIRQLLGVTIGAPPLRGEFVDRLSRDLDGAFSVLRSNTENGTVAYRADSTSTSFPSGAKTGRRSRLRIFGSVAAAAVLLIAVALLSSGPAYGWAAMLDALESCQWVQAITKTTAGNGEQASIGWYSQAAQVAAREQGEARVFLNFRSQTAESFDPTEQVIRQQPLRHDRPLASAFLALLLNTSGSSAPVDDYEIIDESFSKVSAENAQLGRLEVSLKHESTDQVVRLEFLINPATKLPVSGQTLANADFPHVRSIEFAYPQHGPDSIYALGVSQSVKVVTTRSTSDAPSDVNLRDEASTGIEPPVPTVVVEELVVVGGNERSTSPLTADEPTDSSSDPAANALARVETKPVPPLPRPLPPTELVEKLDTLLAEFWQAQGIVPAAPATDSEFLRRVYLDLTGRIPTVSEVYSFLDDPGSDRRERLVDDLLSRRDHATHLAAVWRSILLPEGIDLNAYGGTNKFDRWLADRFGQNLPYDELVRQLLLAEGRVSESGPILFYAALKLNAEEIAAKTARVFLGTRMECAQCHDHPFDDRIAQTDFWGFAAHFAQISRPQGKMEMTSPVLRVRDNDYGEVMLPDTEIVVPPRLPATSAGPVADATDVARSRRHRLVTWLTDANNDKFARAAVNRVWQQLFGRGLIEPVDDIRPENKPVCPEVLDLLAQDFAASGFDLRRLLRALVLTDAYQLSSSSSQDDPSQALCFARMNMKHFSADQLFDCIAVATRSESLAGTAPDGAIARTENTVRERFIEQFRVAAGDRTDYQAGVPQALTLMHGSVVHGATDLTTSGLLSSLNAPFFTDEQRLDTLFLATLSREPNTEEREQLLSYLEAAEDPNDRLSVLGDVLWALLNSAEFTFIH